MTPITAADRAKVLAWAMREEFNSRSDLPAITLHDDAYRAVSLAQPFDVRVSRNA